MRMLVLVILALAFGSCPSNLLIGVVSSTRTDPAVGTRIEYFVTTTGDDSNLGTRESPFRTVKRAQLEVRKQIDGGLRTSISVLIAAGTYELSEALVFGSQDSGTEEHAIRYTAVPGEIVILSGGRRIRNWQVDQDGRWRADLPNVKSGEWFFRQLVVDDRRAVRARWPNEDGDLHLASVNLGADEFGFDRTLGDENLAGHNTELVIYQNWSVTRGRITKSDSNELTTATPMGWIGHGPATTASPGKTVFLEHALRFLDQPGEWYLDRDSGTLYYLPVDQSSDGLSPNGSSQVDASGPGGKVVVAPILRQLVRIAGTAEKPVRNLHFEGIRFEHADFELPEFGYNEIQAAHFGTTVAAATFVHPVAIECRYAANCRFQSCRFAHLNCSGIGFGDGCQGNVVSRCEIDNIGGNGIMIGWRGAGRLKAGHEGKLDADWENVEEAPCNNTVSNCLIHRCGADSFGATAIWVAFSRDTRIVHNQIHELPYTGISVGYRWNTSETTQTRCVVESNHIYGVMQKLADGGGIYTLGFQPGTVFRGNHIHDVGRSRFAHGGAPNNGFFIDEGSKGFVFERNVVHANSGDPVRFNNCEREWHQWNENFFGNEAAQTKEARSVAEQAGIENVQTND